MSVNAGSSSLKFSLFNMDNEECIASGYFERVGLEGGFYTIKYNGEKIKEEVEMPDHGVAVEVLLERLISLGIVTSLDEISGIGHRIVSGGEKYTKSVLVTDQVIQDLLDLKEFISTLNTVQKVEILPYHSIGKYKWTKLGLKYDLENTRDATSDDVKHAKAILGIS